MIIKLIKRRIQQGISLKKLNFWLILLATGVSAMMIYSTYSLSASFANLSRSVNDHRSLEEDAKNLVAASDFLTENVQRYVVTGDARFMDNYITGSTIRRLRENKKLTQDELAEKIFVSNKAVSKWENGHGLPDISLLEPLAKALGVSVIELLSGQDVVNTNRVANMTKVKLYVCPVCGKAVKIKENN